MKHQQDDDDDGDDDGDVFTSDDQARNVIENPIPLVAVHLFRKRKSANVAPSRGDSFGKAEMNKDADDK